MKKIVWIVGCLMLTACSLLSPVKTEPTITYVLDTVPPITNKHHARSITLLVAQTESGAIYNTPKMAYTIRPYQIAYFAKNGWADSPARMLQPLIVKTLQDTHYFRVVSGSALLGHYDYVLNTQLLELQQDFFQDRSVVHFTLRAQVINGATERVIAAKEFSAEEVAPQNNPYGGVIAANRATADVLAQLAKFVTQRKYQ